MTFPGAEILASGTRRRFRRPFESSRAISSKRIMFGSDQMVWPEAIEAAIEAVESADFLSREQKRAIFYDNAWRFFRLDE